MNMELLEHHRQIRDKKHVFVYSVCGRTSSTFLQRVLNSSNEICLYGEPHLIPDHIINTIQAMAYWDEKAKAKGQFEKFKECFEKNRHDLWYANATRDLEPSMEMAAAILSDMFRPVNAVDRFGYKDIRLLDIKTLLGLRVLYPNSIILFLFRDPVRQWDSVKAYMPGDYSNDLNVFMSEFKRISDIYLQFSNAFSNPFFIEDSALRDRDTLSDLLRFLTISSFDENLMKVTVNSCRKESSQGEKDTITGSAGYENYLHMVDLSNGFREKITGSPATI